MTQLIRENEAAPEAGEYPLGAAQEFLCMFAQDGEVGPFGPKYHAARGWRVDGAVDLAALQGALDDVVARHESLRTEIVRDAEPRFQRILAPVSPQLLVEDLSGVALADRERRAEELLNEVEAAELASSARPPLRAVLGRFDDRDSVLVLLLHHTVGDGWSMRVIMRDLAAFYAARKDGGEADLPQLCQYREFAAQQIAETAAKEGDAARAYWHRKLDGAKILALPTDAPRSTDTGSTTASYRFVFEPELSAAALKFAGEMRCSPFMILMAAYNVLLYRRTGIADVAVPTISSGRGQARFDDTVGVFFNFVPLRTDLTGCTTLRDAVTRTRATCLEAQQHSIPFAEVLKQAPEDLMAAFGQDDAAVAALQVFQHPFVMDGERVGGLAFSEIRKRSLSQPAGSDIPNGALWTLEIDAPADIFGNIKFNNHEFREETVRGLLADYLTVLRETVSDPDAPLG